MGIWSISQGFLDACKSCLHSYLPMEYIRKNLLIPKFYCLSELRKIHTQAEVAGLNICKKFRKEGMGHPNWLEPEESI